MAAGLACQLESDQAAEPNEPEQLTWPNTQTYHGVNIPVSRSQTVERVLGRKGVGEKWVIVNISPFLVEKNGGFMVFLLVTVASLSRSRQGKEGDLRGPEHTVSTA